MHKRMSVRSVVVACLLAASSVACSRGGSPSAPSPGVVPAAPVAITAGTVLTLTSGETGAPVAGAAVTVAGSVYAADARGEIALRMATAPGALVDVAGVDYLDRQTLLRSAASTHYSLWPLRSPTGLDESYTRTLVYTSDGGAAGGAPLQRLRLGTTRVFVVPSAALRADPDAEGVLDAALQELDRSAGDLVAYQEASAGPSQGVAVETRVEPTNSVCTETATTRVRGATTVFLNDGEIERAEIVFCTTADARDLVTVTHELGHTLGLRHSPDSEELMAAVVHPRQTTRFSAREGLTIHLLMQRRGGTRFPDNDRQTQGLARRKDTIVCH
jgi:hypothetical protein